MFEVVVSWLKDNKKITIISTIVALVIIASGATVMSMNSNPVKTQLEKHNWAYEGYGMTDYKYALFKDNKMYLMPSLADTNTNDAGAVLDLTYSNHGKTIKVKGNSNVFSGTMKVTKVTDSEVSGTQKPTDTMFSENDFSLTR